MRRVMAMLDYTASALRRRARRNLAIGIGLAVLIAMFSSALFLSEALRGEYHRLSASLPDLLVQRLIAGRPGLITDQEAARVEAIHSPGLRRVRPRVWGYLYVAPLEGNIVVFGIDEPDASLGAELEGSWPAGQDEVVLGNLLAARLGIRVGDQLALLAHETADPTIARVVGILDPVTEVLGADLVITTRATARALLMIPADAWTDLALDLAREEESDVVAATVIQTLEGARVVDKRTLERTYELTFDSRAGFLGALMLPALIAFLLLAWDRLTGLSEGERREIGVLKAIGWSTQDVLLARMLESGWIALLGSSVGVFLGYLHAFVLGAPGLSDALFGWSALHAELRLEPAVDGAQLLAIVGSVVIPFIAVSVAPAWRAAMLDPDRLLRGIG